MTLMQTLTTVAVTIALTGPIYFLLDARAGGQQPGATSRSRELNELNAEEDSELSCKMNELAVRSNLVIRALGDAEGMANATLEAASTIPGLSLDAYQNLLCIEGEDLKNIKSMSIVVPSDWECQSRKVGEPWSCPEGTPSKCRYFDSKRTETRRGNNPFGEAVDLAQLTSAELREVDDMCVRYFCYGLGAQFAADSTFNLLDHNDQCCDYFKPLGKVILTKNVQGALGLDVSGSTYETRAIDDFIDPSATNDFATKVAKICGHPDTGGDYVWTNTHGDWLKTFFWGYSDWRDDPNVDQHLITVGINRFEMGESFGIQLYTPQLDTLRIFTDGSAAFAPTTASVDIKLFDNMSYTGKTDFACPEDVYAVDGEANVGRRRLGVLPNGEHDKTTEYNHPTMEELKEERFRGSCHPSTGCKQGVAAGQGDGAQQGQRRRRELRRGSKMLDSGFVVLRTIANRAGND